MALATKAAFQDKLPGVDKDVKAQSMTDQVFADQLPPVHLPGNLDTWEHSMHGVGKHFFHCKTMSCTI